MDRLSINENFKNLKYRLYCYAHCKEYCSKNYTKSKKLKFMQECIPECNDSLINFFTLKKKYELDNKDL